MVNVTVLLENTTSNPAYKNAHGLSLLIRTDEQHILLDTGPDGKFYKNAQKMGIGLSQIDTLVLSHAHYDHTGGLNKFCQNNQKAPILMFSNNDEKLYGTRKFLKKYIYHKYIGLKGSKKNQKRITLLDRATQISTHCWFIPPTVDYYGKPDRNVTLYKKVRGRLVNDDFKHEGILVYDDKGELVVFNSCSHSGVINSIESAREFFPNKKVRAYVGGFHFPYKTLDAIRPEDIRNMDEIVDYAHQQPGITFYTGHCTGLGALEYLQNKLGTQLEHLQTGLQFEI